MANQQGWLEKELRAAKTEVESWSPLKKETIRRTVEFTRPRSSRTDSSTTKPPDSSKKPE